ncbi:MAG TPA: porin family protein [Bacteroidales bacterium]|nr:porin family protein [Bacteroidales bacterium]
MKTIKILIVVLSVLLFAGITSAQDLKRVEFGLRYMPTIASIDFKAYNNDIVKGSVSFNQGFGIRMGFNLSKHVGIETEVDYYQISQSFRDLDLSNKVNIKYFNIPVLLSLNTNRESVVNLNVVVGPSFGINAGASIKSSGTSNTENVRAVAAVKKGDIGFAYGAGLEFALNSNHTLRLDLGYRGFYGLVKIDANKTSDNTYNVIANASRKTNAAYAGITFLF